MNGDVTRPVFLSIFFFFLFQYKSLTVSAKRNVYYYCSEQPKTANIFTLVKRENFGRLFWLKSALPGEWEKKIFFFIFLFTLLTLSFIITDFFFICLSRDFFLLSNYRILLKFFEMEMCRGKSACLSLPSFHSPPPPLSSISIN